MQDTKIYAWRKVGTEEPIQLGPHTWFSRAAFAISYFCQTYRGWLGRDTKPTDYEIAEYELTFIKAEQPPVCSKCKDEILSNKKDRAANLCCRCRKRLGSSGQYGSSSPRPGDNIRLIPRQSLSK